MPVSWVQPPHPSTLPVPDLLAKCSFRAQRRSGPGGQHRNKTSSGVFLQYLPTGIVAEATERRSQAANRSAAVTRLRYQLAVAVRTGSSIDRADVSVDPLEAQLRESFQGKSLRLSDSNEAKPALLALLLNDLHAAGGQPSGLTTLWGTTTSRVVAIVKSYPPAFELLNTIRRHHGRRPLK